MRPVFLFASILMFAMRADAAGGIQVAEYRADVDDIAWNVGVETQDIRSGDGVTEPFGLTGVETTGTAERGFNLGSYRLSGMFDLYHRQNSAADQAYDTEAKFSVGPKFYFSPNSVARLFYSLEQDQALDDSSSGRWGGDSFARRTGLSQTWHFARRRAQITLGYGFEQSETEDIYDDLSAHSVIFNSRFPLFWGLGARIQANYAQNSYDDYLGVGGVDSNKKLFQAAINRSFSQRLLGEFQFSYLDEDFDETELSYRRYIWGLNLRYKY